MGRVYSIAFSEVTMAATTDYDIFGLSAPATGMLRVLSIQVGQFSDFSDSEAEILPWTIARPTALGSGGTAATETPLQVGHAGTGATGRYMDTTPGSTPTIIMAGTWNIQAGFYYNPIPEEMIWIPPSGHLVFTQPDDGSPATAYTTAFSGTLIYEEFD